MGFETSEQCQKVECDYCGRYVVPGDISVTEAHVWAVQNNWVLLPGGRAVCSAWDCINVLRIELQTHCKHTPEHKWINLAETPGGDA